MESKTKKKVGTVVGGVAAIGAAVTLTAGTFSYFSSTYKSPGQHVTTGNLKLGTTTTSSISADNWKPGDHLSKTFTLENSGSLKGHLKVRLNNVSPSSAKLRNALQVQVGNHAPGTLAQVEDHGYQGFGTLDAGGTRDFTVKVWLPNKDHQQNDLQGQEVTAKVQATLETPHPS
jgi:hypothetical protein